jgi:HSP20 family protein
MSMLSPWDPTRELLTMQRAMDRLFSDPLAGPSVGTRNAASTSFLPIDVYTTEDEVVVTASLPGLTAEDVDIVFQDNTITFRGEFKPPVGNVQWAVQERPYGKFSRTLTLNVPLDVNKAEATFEYGILRLRLPKAESAKPHRIQIKGNSQAKQIAASSQQG